MEKNHPFQVVPIFATAFGDFEKTTYPTQEAAEAGLRERAAATAEGLACGRSEILAGVEVVFVCRPGPCELPPLEGERELFEAAWARAVAWSEEHAVEHERRYEKWGGDGAECAALPLTDYAKLCERGFCIWPVES